MFLVDGFSTVVTFSGLPGIFLREREVTPPELDAGGEIDTSTMLNSRMRTRAAKSLATLGKVTMMCQYDPFVYSQLATWLGVVQVITVVFPDGFEMSFPGWVDKFTPPSHKEGDFPLATVEIIPSNTNQTPVSATAANDVLPDFEDGNQDDQGLVVR